MKFLKKLFSRSPAAADTTTASTTTAGSRPADVEQVVQNTVSVILGTRPGDIPLDTPLRERLGGMYQIDLVEIVDSLEAEFDIGIADEAWFHTSTPNWEDMTQRSLVEIVTLVLDSPGAFGAASQPAGATAPASASAGNPAGFAIRAGVEGLRNRRDAGAAVEAFEMALAMVMGGAALTLKDVDCVLSLEDKYDDPVLDHVARLYQSLLDEERTTEIMARNLSSFYMAIGQPERGRTWLERAVDASN
jgi:acyl carrier protein